jgi:hypothetical protein
LAGPARGRYFRNDLRRQAKEMPMRVTINGVERELNKAQALALAEWMLKVVGRDRFLEFCQEFLSVALPLPRGKGCRLHIRKSGDWHFTVEDEQP